MFTFKENNCYGRLNKIAKIKGDNGDELYMSLFFQVAKGESEDIVKHFCDNHYVDFLKFKKDSDIVQPHGFDIITKYANFDHFLRNFEVIKTLCDDATKCGFKAHEAKQCKMKINLFKNELITPKLMRKIDLFVGNNYDFFKMISRRTKNNLKMENNKYHDDLGKNRSGDNAICFGEQFVGMNFFRSTLNVNTIIATLGVCHALIYFLDGVVFDALYDNNNNVFKEYRKFIKNNYPMVENYINERENI